MNSDRAPLIASVVIFTLAGGVLAKFVVPNLADPISKYLVILGLLVAGCALGFLVFAMVASTTVDVEEGDDDAVHRDS